MCWHSFFFFFSTLDTGPRRSLNLKLAQRLTVRSRPTQRTTKALSVAEHPEICYLICKNPPVGLRYCQPEGNTGAMDMDRLDPVCSSHHVEVGCMVSQRVSRKKQNSWIWVRRRVRASCGAPTVGNSVGSYVLPVPETPTRGAARSWFTWKKSACWSGLA